MRPVILALAAAGAALAACSPKAPEAPSSVAVAEAWCRPTSEGAPTAACYLTLTATADDRLTAVATPLAERGEIHAMDMSGGVMRMRKLEDGVSLPAGAAVNLRPGAEHLMLIGPKQPLKEGESVGLTLTFAKAPAQQVEALVRAAPPAVGGAMGAMGAMDHSGGHH
ncbi:copper chaperone PCu(A)C [Phenylobacterium sp.]|uniref:copper chaperone PCu(A)C n=1 Tax=Phenylobacterium sp. TaxID=1871053 RepID=UPI0035B1C2D4